MGTPSMRAVSALDASLRGALIGQADLRYDRARRVWNGRIDRRLGGVLANQLDSMLTSLGSRRWMRHVRPGADARSARTSLPSSRTASSMGFWRTCKEPLSVLGRHIGALRGSTTSETCLAVWPRPRLASGCARQSFAELPLREAWRSPNRCRYESRFH